MLYRLYTIILKEKKTMGKKQPFHLALEPTVQKKIRMAALELDMYPGDLVTSLAKLIDPIRFRVKSAIDAGFIPDNFGPHFFEVAELVLRMDAGFAGTRTFDPDFQMFDVPLVLRYATGGGDVLQAQKWACRSCGHLQVVPEMKKLPPISQGEVVESMPEGDLKPKPTMIEVVRGHAF